MVLYGFYLMIRRPPRSTLNETLFPYRTLFRSLLHGYLRGFRARGGKLVANGGVQVLERDAQGWRVRTRNGSAYRGQVVVNAAGAWADEVAGLAGAQPVRPTPKRRTAILFAAPTDGDSKAWPLVIDAAEHFYFKPDACNPLPPPAPNPRHGAQ